MRTADQLYVRALYDRFGYFGTWLPNARIALGDVGEISGGLFRRHTTLAELGVLFTVRRSASGGLFHHTSHSSIHFTAEASATIGAQPPAPGAKLTVTFDRTGAFVFQADDCSVIELENKVKLGQAVSTLVGSNWDPKWVVVDKIVEAGAATILVAHSGRAQSELSAAASSPDVVSQLAVPSAGLTWRRDNGSITRFVAEAGLTPLYTVSQPHRRLFDRVTGKQTQPIKFGGGGGKAQLASESDWWEPVAPDQ